MQNIRAFGMNLDVSNSDFQTIVHAVATNENRAEFARRSIYISQTEANSKNDKTINDKYRLEKGFLGAHSDIGGGYESGDLSNVALMWMIKQAEKKGGIKFGKYGKYKQINNPIVHDSLWSMPLFSAGDQFRWATDDSKDKSPAKGSDMTDGGVLMAANKENKIIAINDYLYWLKCHYGIDLKYTNKKIKSSETALSDKQLCSGIPLHKQVKK